MKRAMTAEQKAASEERRKTFRKIAAHVAAMTPEQRQAFAAQYPVVATVEGRALSIYNQCLLACQCPTVSIVGGFRQWINAGRAVRKGEHGLMIWIPRFPKDENAQPGEISSADTELRFLIAPVFDVSQTDEIAKQGAA